MENLTIYWHKLNKNTKLPTKRDEDAGFDVYTIEDEVVLMPHEKRLMKTGLSYAIEGPYWLLAYDRGSTGSKGIHTHCGICDNGYRGEVFICLCNDNDKLPVYFTSTVEKVEVKYVAPYGKVLCYPTSKAIAQLIPMYQPTVNTVEVDDENWNKFLNTERGTGALGQSGK